MKLCFLVGVRVYVMLVPKKVGIGEAEMFIEISLLLIFLSGSIMNLSHGLTLKRARSRIAEVDGKAFIKLV